jgi:hypothetical protein
LALKGESSAHFQHVKEVRTDCDRDVLLFKVVQDVAACHEGYRSCFFRQLDNAAGNGRRSTPKFSIPTPSTPRNSRPIMSRSEPVAVQRIDYKTAAAVAGVAPWIRLPLILSAAYVFMILAGIVVLRLPGARVRGNEFSFEGATFTSINAATLTGFQQAVAIDEYGASGQACMIVLTAGGTIFSLLVGGILLARLLRLNISDARLIGVTLFATAFAVACGTAILAEPGRGLLASAVQSLSAFGNSGWSLAACRARAIGNLTPPAAARFPRRIVDPGADRNGRWSVPLAGAVEARDDRPVALGGAVPGRRDPAPPVRRDGGR